MNIAPQAENSGVTFGIRAGNGTRDGGVRVMGSSRPSRSEPLSDMSTDDDDEFTALMNDDKRKPSETTDSPHMSRPLDGAPRNGSDAGGVFGSSDTGSRPMTPPYSSQYSPEDSSRNAHTPNDQWNGTPDGGSSGFRSLEEEKYHFLTKIQRMQTRIPGRRMSVETPLDELKMEYDRLKRQTELNQSVKFQRRCLMGFCTGAEFLNKTFNPLNVHLDGWSETVMDSLEEYDPIFEQLHDKYTGTAEISPEWSLMIMLGGSAFMYHLSNTLFKSVLPSVSDVSKQNPELMQNIANAMSAAMAQNGAAGPMPGGGSTGQMGANLMAQAMQAQAKKPQHTDTATYDSGSIIEEDETQQDEFVVPPTPARRPMTGGPTLPQIDPSALPMPHVGSRDQYNDDDDDLASSVLSSELSGLSETRSVGGGGASSSKRRKTSKSKKDSRRAVEIQL
jgi:hypothetical protein